MKSFNNLLLVLYLLSGSADALELGEMQLGSHLNETLDASFTIANINANNLNDIIISIASSSAYESLGLSRPSYLSRLTFSITPGEGEEHSVKVSSRQRMQEPIMELLVQVTEKQSKVMRLYTLMLDPVGSERVFEKTENRPISPEPVEQRTPLVDQSLPLVGESTRQIRVDNTSISMIAQNSDLHDNYSVYQIMRGFYLENPTAFLDGNINRLQSGFLLQVPLVERVAEVPRQKAINFVYSVSRDNPVLNTKKPSTEQSAENRSDQLKPEINAPAVPLILTSTTSFAQPDAQNVQISSDVQQDLITWRGMTDEFTNLSTIIDQQNQVIKLQGEVVKEISFELDSKTEQMFDFNNRLNLLEKTTPAQSLITTSGEPAVESLLQEVNRVKQQQSDNMEQVIAQLDVKNREISRLNSRIEELESGKARLPVDEGKLRVAVAGEPAAIVVSEAEEISIFQDSRLWLFFLLSVVLLFAAREYNWRRRVKQSGRTASAASRHAHITPLAEEPIQPTEGRSYPPGEKPDAKRLADSIAWKLEFQENNKPPARKSKSRSGKSSKADLVAVQQSDTEREPDTVKQVHAEIDVLIAYELFSEAQELVESARKKNSEDHWLVLKELEILAYLKDVDVFLSRVEHEKNLLSSEFPEAWSKILKMRDDLCSEFKLASIH